MKILLDTNLLITPPRFERLPADEDHRFFTSAISYAEIQEGEFSDDPLVRIQAPLDYLRAAQQFGEGLPFDDLAAHVYRVVCQAVVRHGRQVNRARRIDLMIAAITLSNDCTLATRNCHDFAGLEPILDVIEL